MIAFFTLFCTIFVSILIIKRVYQVLFCHFIGPALYGEFDFKKTGRWAVITGSSDGIGKAYAEALAKRGMDVVLISRTKEKLEAVAEDIENRFRVSTKIIVADLTGGKPVYSQIEKELFDMDIGVLVNNVGTSNPYPACFLEVNGANAVYNEIVQLNIVAGLKMCQILMPGMVEKKKGVIINIASATGLFPSPLLSVYGATKKFVSKFTEDLAAEYKNSGLTIQCVAPGFVSTKLTRIRKPTYFVPTPKVFVESALKTVGIESETLGFGPHRLMLGSLIYLNFVSKTAATSIVKRSLSQLRAKALRRL